MPALRGQRKDKSFFVFPDKVGVIYYKDLQDFLKRLSINYKRLYNENPSYSFSLVRNMDLQQSVHIFTYHYIFPPTRLTTISKPLLKVGNIQVRTDCVKVSKLQRMSVRICLLMLTHILLFRRYIEKKRLLPSAPIVNIMGLIVLIFLWLKLRKNQ